MSKRCVTPQCGKWANQGLLCKDCARIPDAVRAADVVNRMSDIMTMPAMQTLVGASLLFGIVECLYPLWARVAVWYRGDVRLTMSVLLLPPFPQIATKAASSQYHMQVEVGGGGFSPDGVHPIFFFPEKGPGHLLGHGLAKIRSIVDAVDPPGSTRPVDSTLARRPADPPPLLQCPAVDAHRRAPRSTFLGSRRMASFSVGQGSSWPGLLP